jgi:streptomycin 3"-adenylyltransferase
MSTCLLNTMTRMRDVIDRVSDYFDSNCDALVGLYLYGSSISGGLQRESDIDVLAVTRRSLSTPERVGITDLLLRFSGRRATAEPGRPVELTSVVHSELSPWRYPPVCDYQYGEWLREDITAGQVPAPHPDPDLAILISSARSSSKPLRGPAFEEITDPVPAADLRRAIHDSVQPLLGDLHGDERNVLLTLARMVVTLETGQIVSKDDAARRVMSGLPPSSRELLDLACQGYLGAVADDWTHNRDQTRETAERLAAHVRRL